MLLIFGNLEFQSEVLNSRSSKKWLWKTYQAPLQSNLSWQNSITFQSCPPKKKIPPHFPAADGCIKERRLVFYFQEIAACMITGVLLSKEFNPVAPLALFSFTSSFCLRCSRWIGVDIFLL